jgi:DNA-binding MurR/RpiR family transcriptional regulator
MTIAEDVRDRLDEMSPSERRVARALFAAYPTAGLESLPQLAESANVTGPTVLRFVRKVGYDGYPDFQRDLRREVQERMEGLLSLSETTAMSVDGESRRRSMDAFTHALQQTLAAPSLGPELNRVVALLADPKRHTWFVGGRFSRLVAEYLCLLLRMFRPGCSMIGEAPTNRATAALDVRRGDVLVLFDYRRYQPDTVAVGRLAADRGAVVVVVTDPWLSPAVEYARHVLISSSDSPSPIDSMLSGFALAEVIGADVLTALGEAGRDRVAGVEATQDQMFAPREQGNTTAREGNDGSAD